MILAFELALGLIFIIHWLCCTPAHWYGNQKEGVTMTLPESEIIDHSWNREEKTQNTDSHNTIKLKQPTQLEKDSNYITK